MSRFPTWLIIAVAGILGIFVLLIVIGAITSLTEDETTSTQAEPTPTIIPTPTSSSLTSPNNPLPTPTPSPVATSVTSIISSMLDECSSDPACRLKVTSNELRKVFEQTNVWNLERKEGVGGKQVFAAYATDTPMSVLWVDQDGIVFAEIIVHASTLGHTATQARVSEVVSAIVPVPWEVCLPCDIISYWSSLDKNPSAREDPPGFNVNDVAIQLNYVDHGPTVVATLWKLDR